MARRQPQYRFRRQLINPIVSMMIGMASFCSTAVAYDRSQAINYVTDWWNKCNPEYYPHGYYNQGGDCADFGSQVLIAGGIRFINQTGTDPFGAIFNAQTLRDDLKAFHGVSETSVQPASLEPGDIIFLVYPSGSPNGPAGIAHHTMIVRQIVNGVPWMAYHDTDRSGTNPEDALDSLKSNFPVEFS